MSYSLPDMNVGIDQEQWKIGSKFRGFKLVPTGFHIITMSNIDSMGNCGMNTSILLWIDPNASILPIIVLEYDPIIEDWDCSTDISTVSTIKEQYILWDNFLAAYSINNNKIFSQNSKITLDSLIDLCSTPLKFYHPNNYDKHKIFKIDSTTHLRFPDIKLHNSYPPESPPSIITKYSLDKSYLLKQQLLSSTSLLSYVSISFLLFLYAQNLDGLDFWKKSFCMICYSEEILTSDPHLSIPLFISWMDITLNHLKLLNSGTLSDPLTQSLFCSIDDSDSSWVWNALATLFMNIDDTLSIYEYETLKSKSISFQKEIEGILHISLSRTLE